MYKPLQLAMKTVLVTGGAGFLGRSLVKQLRKRGIKKLIVPRLQEYDLTQKLSCQQIVRGVDVLIHLAAKVGGIGYNLNHPAEMFYDNIMMSMQLMHEAWQAGVEKFVAIGTVCCYPKFTPIPFREDNLWSGYPEETNAPYGLAKKMSLVQAQAYRKQYGFNAIFLLPANLYGPGDNFDPESSHVIPAIIRKLTEARETGQSTVVIWGNGEATREFIHVDDAARAILLATERYNKPEPINIGSGFEISIKNLATFIAKLVGYSGTLVWDTSKPEGQPRRMLETSRAMKEFGFVVKIPFEKGLKQEIRWFETHVFGKF